MPTYSSSRWSKVLSRLGGERLALIALGLGIFVHAWVMAGPVWQRVNNSEHGGDFASYYYAVQVAVDGVEYRDKNLGEPVVTRDPYERRALSAMARGERTRRSVHPFFYPPPYLLTMAWALPLELGEAYRVWFWCNGLFLFLGLLALWKWNRGTGVAAGLGLILATYTPIWDTYWMGQANIALLALVAWGLYLVESSSGGFKRVWGGALMGLACMMKMSPGLLVAWWLVRARWSAVLGACGCAVLLSVFSLPLVDAQTQWRFYTEVLPSFSSGDYNGLTVPITMYGNHSITNLVVQGFGELNSMAHTLSSVLNLGLLAGALYLLRAVNGDSIRVSAAAGALVVLMLLVPAYTYEHHMSLLVIPLVALSAGLQAKRLSWAWGVGVLASYGLLAWQLQAVKRLGRGLPSELTWLLQESKFAAALFVGVACMVLARRRTDSAA